MDGAPGFLPFGEVESGFDLVEGEPFELSDFGFLFFGELFGIFGVGEEENNGFNDIEAGDVVGEGEAGGFIEGDVEAGFFFDFAEGGFDFGFARFDVTFGEAGETVVLMNDENFVVMNDNGAARSFGGGVSGSVGGGVSGREVREVGVSDSKSVHGNIIYYSAGVW